VVVLAFLSAALTLWQWLAACLFPLHRRRAGTGFAPGVTLLKPLKHRDVETEKCLRSWFTQDYAGPVQILLGVASTKDPVCELARELIAEFPQRDAQLVVCPETLGTNLKVSKLIQLERLAEHEILVVSDADVLAPADFLANTVGLLRDEAVGLVNCFYRLANPVTAAMRWEAVAINADFWGSVLQARSLGPLDFALGAAMLVRRKRLAKIGGFAAIVDCLADDYQLGNRIAAQGGRIELSPVVVECWDPPQDWTHVWRHQLRWARTIRVSRPVAYFFSVLSNATLWPLLWMVLRPSTAAAEGFLACLAVRVLTALHLQWKLNQSAAGCRTAWLVPVKDLLQAGLWFGAFAGSEIEWRGERYHLRSDGTMEIPQSAFSESD
jgi:ceramide glucosyltransferase